MTNPELLADKIIDSLGISDPSDLLLMEDMAWARHRAVVRSAPLSGAEARLSVLGGRAVITVSTMVGNDRRRRFCIAHELGHLEMRHSGGLLNVCSTRDLNSWHHKDKQPTLEQLSNQFAAALLLPERFFAGCCVGDDPSLDCIAGLADKFDVSLTATAIRYATYCQEQVAIVYSESGFIKWFHASPDFDELGVFINVRGCLDSETIADRIFRGEKPRGPAKRVPASSWLSGTSIREDARLLEQSWTIPSCDSAITLLWVDEDIDDDSCD